MDDQGLESDGASTAQWDFEPYLKVIGPAIVKVQVIASTADIDVTAGFSGILVDK